MFINFTSTLMMDLFLYTNRPSPSLAEMFALDSLVLVLVAVLLGKGAPEGARGL
jgi:hypothetical protein